MTSKKVTNNLEFGLVIEKGNLMSANSAHAGQLESGKFFIDYANGYGVFNSVNYDSQADLESAMKKIAPLTMWREYTSVVKENS